MKTLNQKLCQTIQDRGIMVETEWKWHKYSHVTRRGGEKVVIYEWRITDLKFQVDDIPALSTLDEFVRLFKEMGKVKGWNRWADHLHLQKTSCADCSNDDMEFCPRCGYSQAKASQFLCNISEWKHHLLRFTELYATEGEEEAERYLGTLLK